MTDIYGVNNGFGWKLGEIIGAQIVTVPMALPLERARATFTTFMILLGAVFLLLLVLLNILLHFVVIRPVKRISTLATEVSMGKADVPEYIKPGSDEIASLSQSFNRMRLSLESAMKMLGE
jgi:protein-histidine pros-kinase